jgi:Carboxypeptidase regulatory-like domain
MKLSRPIVFVLFLAFSAVGAWAQSTATLAGTVTDPTGAVVANAQVKIHSLATATDRNVITDAAGAYDAPSLQPGDYQIEASAAGFSSFKVEKVTLNVDQHVTVNMKLAVSSAGETVQVESSTASQIETQTITVGQVIDRAVVQEIPLNGRHFLDLTVLTAGGVIAPATGSLTAPSRGLGANSFVTAGNREDSVNFQINGVNLNDMTQNQITFQPSINTTSEFRINNSTYSAEYGRSSGSIVNVSTRSGSNKFHGEVFDYLRNNSFDTRNFFDLKGTAQAALKRNNFGASVGGPIWHDKTFFFGSYEGLRQHQGLALAATVPDAADRANTTDPVAKQLLTLIPVGTPNNATSNIISSTVNGPVQTDQGTMDILHVLNQKDTVHGFYAIQKDVRTEPNLQGNTVPGFGDHRVATRQILTINETHVFNSRLVNEARLGFNRIAITFAPNSTVDPTSLGFNNYPAGITPGGGIPQITISGYSLNIGGPSGFPQGRFDTMGVISDTLNYTSGKNQFKFGGEFRRFLNANFSNDPGTLSFVATPSLTFGGVTLPARSAIQNFQLGQAGGFSITPSAVTDRLYSNSFAGFAVDNFKLTPTFTVEAGFRFEWNGPANVGGGKAVVFDTATVSLYRVGTFGFNHLYQNNYNYEPRVGFIYDISGTGKTILRGGFGIMADQPETNLVGALNSNPPLTNKVSYTASTSAPAPGSTALPLIPLESLFSSAAAAAISVGAVDPNYRNAYTETFNLNLQHQFPGALVFTAGYYGSVGRHLRQGVNINEILPTTGARTYLKLAATSPIDPNVSINANITQAKGNGVSNYNGLWMTATKSTNHGLQGTLNYQYTKSMDLGSLAGGQFTDILQPRLNYGLSDFDTRHRISANAIYDLPFKGNRFIEGFRLSTITQWQTGNPLNVTTASTYTGTAGVQHPNLIASIPYAKNYVISGTSETVQWLNNPAATVCATAVAGCVFQLPATGFGNMQRNGAKGPGFTDVDVSIEKVTTIAEGVKLNLRLDAFDVFNHPNFGNPGTSATVGSSSFGVITATRFPVADLGSSRQLQLSAKFLF